MAFFTRSVLVVGLRIGQNIIKDTAFSVSPTSLATSYAFHLYIVVLWLFTGELHNSKHHIQVEGKEREGQWALFHLPPVLEIHSESCPYQFSEQNGVTSLLVDQSEIRKMRTWFFCLCSRKWQKRGIRDVFYDTN